MAKTGFSGSQWRAAQFRANRSHHDIPLWTPSDFADIAPRTTIDKNLQRLTNEGQLRRIDRGLYDRPVHNRLTGKLTVPDPRAVIDAMARRDQLRVIVDGMTAANDLGRIDIQP